MNLFNMDIPKDINNRLLEVQKACPEFDVYLGGGFLRDTYFNKGTAFYEGVGIKDVDVFLVPKVRGCPKEVPAAACSGFYVNYHKDASLISDMEDRNVHCLTGLYSGYMSTTEWQFITYSCPMTQEELCSDMDIGLNQIMHLVGDDRQVMASDNFIRDHTEREITLYHTYDEVRMYERMQRMQKKFKGYTMTNCPEAPEKVSMSRSGGSGSSNSVALYEVFDDAL